MENKRFERLFDPDSDSGKILVKWWEELEDRRGNRAELRRVKSPAEVVFSPAYHWLYQQLPHLNKEAIASLAGLCAHVKENRSEMKVAEQMATGDKKAVVSGLRFRRLLAVNDRDELYRTMIRIIRMLGSIVNICDLAQAVY